MITLQLILLLLTWFSFVILTCPLIGKLPVWSLYLLLPVCVVIGLLVGNIITN